MKGLCCIVTVVSLMLPGCGGSTDLAFVPEPGERNKPQEWLESFAGKGPNFKDGNAFFLRVHWLKPGINTFDVEEQNVFRWQESFPAIIITQNSSLDFTIQDGTDKHEFTAVKSKDYTGMGNNEEEGEFFWEGTIRDQDEDVDDDSSGILGELSCGFSWGTLDCTIRAFSDVVDSHYRIIMEEWTLTVIRTLKTDLYEAPEEAVPGSQFPNNEDQLPPQTGEMAKPSGISGVGHYQVDGSGVSGVLQRITHLDVVVFYTEAACSQYASCAALEREIRNNIIRFNAALSDAGPSRVFEELNLVAAWKLYEDDSSEWENWIGRGVSDSVLKSFTHNRALNNRRSLFGADLMVLVHDWDSGAGIGYRSGYSSLVNSKYLPNYSIQHGLGHNFNLTHCMGYATSAAKRINKWSPQSGASSRQANDTPDNNGPSLAECMTEVYGTQTGEGGLFHVWANNTSRGAVRLSPSVVGNQIHSDWRVCKTGIRGLGLLRFRHDGDGEIDNYRLQVVCRGERQYQQGLRSTGYDSVEKIDPRSCRDGNFVQGVALYRYRDQVSRKGNYRLGISCPGEGWIFTPEPGGDLISSDSRTSTHGVKEDLTIIKFNTFAGADSTDTYDMSLGFFKPSAPTQIGSLLQDVVDYRCMTSNKKNIVVANPCHGGPNQQWYINGSNQITNTASPDLCLTVVGSDSRVALTPCDTVSSTQQWIYDRSTQHFRSGANAAKCLQRDMVNNILIVRTCNDNAANQKLVFDTYTFSTLSGGYLNREATRSSVTRR